MFTAQLGTTNSFLGGGLVLGYLAAITPTTPSSGIGVGITNSGFNIKRGFSNQGVNIK